MYKTLLIILCITLFNSIQAQWNTNTAINTPVVIASKSQSNAHTVSDTKGGAIIAWDDNQNSLTSSYDIYAQRIKKNGFAKWTSNGVAICSNISTQKSVSITEAGNGSAIITWEDDRAGNYDIYAQKIDSSGNVLWTIDGVAVCNKTTNQKNPKIISDNADGAIIVWEDSVNFYWDVYAQRISATGTLLWTSGGVSICNAPNIQINPKLDVDGLGGAVFTWQDKRNNVDYNIYAQRINNLGTTLWTANGVVVCNATNTQSNPRIEPDGSNGALIGWVDKRNGLDYDIYAQKINSLGAAEWTSNGLLVCGANNNQSALDMKYIGSSGLVLCWKDDRTSTNEIYAQLVSLAGVNQLTSNGILISNGLKSINPNTINDGSGGAIIAWQDSTSVGWDIKSQRLNPSGAPLWTIGGVAVSTAADDQINVSQTTDGLGGAIYVWEDYRSATNYDLYAHHLFNNGTAFVGIKELSNSKSILSLCYPNPINSSSTIQLKNNISASNWEISIFNAYGQLIKTQHIKNNENCVLNYDEFSAGVYFYLINLEGETSFSKGTFISTK